MTHAERDPMLTDSFPSSSHHKLLTPAAFSKSSAASVPHTTATAFLQPGEEFHVKYEDNTDPASNRQEMAQQSLVMAGEAGPSTTYATLHTYSHAYPAPEYPPQGI